MCLLRVLVFRCSVTVLIFFHLRRRSCFSVSAGPTVNSELVFLTFEEIKGTNGGLVRSGSRFIVKKSTGGYRKT